MNIQPITDRNKRQRNGARWQNSVTHQKGPCSVLRWTLGFRFSFEHNMGLQHRRTNIKGSVGGAWTKLRVVEVKSVGESFTWARPSLK